MSVLFHYLAFLNITDGILTYYGLKNGLITEMNPLMALVFEMDAVLFLIIKISLSLLLYPFLFFKKMPATRLVKGMTIFASMLYTGVLAMHSLWLF